MGAIKHALLEGRFEDAGEAIESELQEHSDAVAKALRRQDGVIDGSIISTGRSLREQDKRIEALEQKIRMNAFLETIPPEPMPPDIPTDKDRPFRVGDTIAFYANEIRIVLWTNANNSEMKLMDVPSGNTQTASYPEGYTLVYRPGSPKPEPTVKEKIPTDKFGKPDGGLELGDVISVTKLRDFAIFSHRTSGWIYGQLIPGGKLCCLYPSHVAFLFRPKKD